MVALTGNLSVIVYHTDCNESSEDPQMIPIGSLYTTPESQSQSYECPECKAEVNVVILNEESNEQR